MGMPARLMWTVLAVAAAMQPARALAAAADRFVPATPGYVVADLRASQPDEPLRRLHAHWRAHPADESAALALASALVERARLARAPGLFGRAESVLQEHASRPGASAPVRRLYAQTLQFRHDFHGAAAVLDSLLRDDPRDADSRLRRAALRLTTGDFDGARGDCVQLITAGSALSAAGFACLAEALAARGELPRARTLLASLSEGTSPAGLQAYLLSTRAGLAERAGDPHAAIADYGRALELTPNDDAIRAALADVLTFTGDVAGARRVLDIDQPSLALLVRSAALEQGDARAALIRRARSWIALEAAREDAPHEREVALLEIAAGAPAAALAAARRNFGRQRELADVRVLARAAMLADDVPARAQLRRWLDDTRYQDAVTGDILHARPRG